jgi:hypothetical protein
MMVIRTLLEVININLDFISKEIALVNELTQILTNPTQIPVIFMPLPLGSMHYESIK